MVSNMPFRSHAHIVLHPRPSMLHLNIIPLALSITLMPHGTIMHESIAAEARGAAVVV